MEKAMLDELVDSLLKLFPDQAVQIVLYGSVARGTAADDSDIDIALFLNGRLTPGQEDSLSDIVVDLNLKYNKVFSVIDIDRQTYLKWKDATPFYQNIDREGIVLWKAA